jgi:hypothetical protein
MTTRTATLAIIGVLALGALAISAGHVEAQASAERGPEAAAPEARGRPNTAPGPQRQEGRAPAEAAPGQPEIEEAPSRPGSCPDQGRKLELIV